MLKKPKIEQGQEVAVRVVSNTQIPDDREGLLAFLDQRANSIKRLKDQISILEKKLVEERQLVSDAEAKFLRIDRVENGTLSKTNNVKVPARTGSLLGLEEFWTEEDEAKIINERSTPRPRSEVKTSSIKSPSFVNETSSQLRRNEMESLKGPSIILPPSFKRRASATVRPEVNETTRASQPMAIRDYNIQNEENNAPVTKRPRSIPDEVLRETQGRDNQIQPQGRDNRTSAQARDNHTNKDVAKPRSKVSPNISRDNQTPAQARDNYTNKDVAKPRIKVSSNISRQGQQENSGFQGHDELMAHIGRSPLCAAIEARTEGMMPSCHTKRARSLALSPANRELFATSALDGIVHFWKLNSNRSTATRIETVIRVGLDQIKWAEDIAWHPHKSALFSVYTADDGHPQISAMYLNEARESCESKFLKDKPHSKGLINRIMFTPWDDPCFITGGSDHGVVLWRDRHGDNDWKPKLLHKDLHSSSVMGVAGMRHNNLVLSCGDDKKFVGYDAQEEKQTFRHILDNRCTSLLPNPRDVNLVMVHTRQLDRQLRLYDVRIPQTELSSFGWKQQSSVSQSALINQSWSPDGLLISSGSADPEIHIFDIRFNGPSPALSIKAHKKRVFKAEWHSSSQLLVSISSDSEIGFHKLWENL